jgi:hypothetical protein
MCSIPSEAEIEFNSLLTQLKKPFDRFEPSQVGEDTPDPLFLEIGRALTEWEKLESQLADIFELTTGAKPRPHWEASPAKRAYGTISSFNSRQKMVLEAAEVYWRSTFHPYHQDDPPFDDLKKYLNKVGMFAARRNDIAHGEVRQILEVSEFTFLSGPFKFEPDQRYFLIPASYASKTDKPPQLHAALTPGAGSAMQSQFALGLLRNGPGAYKYNSVQVAYYGRQFTALAAEAKELIQRMLTRPLALRPAHLRE